eukprot:TRINITY_DN2554_c0_g2_i1.p1 TRINITY_DN2554_c0_g2~~TRINITY_DN2554_c0_g2_i1.p1  ORF type:complete len:512 (+),score=119.30 TRINITY_DN2554_c0_g2_i1:160-1695(+)
MEWALKSGFWNKFSGSPTSLPIDDEQDDAEVGLDASSKDSSVDTTPQHGGHATPAVAIPGRNGSGMKQHHHALRGKKDILDDEERNGREQENDDGPEWACSVCTFINNGKRYPEQCSMCGCANPALEAKFFFSTEPTPLDLVTLPHSASPLASSGFLAAHHTHQQHSPLYQASPPKDFLCPITQDIMVDPVCAEDGYTYEREAIMQWVRSKGTSPITREMLVSTSPHTTSTTSTPPSTSSPHTTATHEIGVLFPNRVLKRQIEDYLRAQQWTAKKLTANRTLADVERRAVAELTETLREGQRARTEMRAVLREVVQRIRVLETERQDLVQRLHGLRAASEREVAAVRSVVDSQAAVLESVAAEQRNDSALSAVDPGVTKLLLGIDALRDRLTAMLPEDQDDQDLVDAQVPGPVRSVGAGASESEGADGASGGSARLCYHSEPAVVVVCVNARTNADSNNQPSSQQSPDDDNGGGLSTESESDTESDDDDDDDNDNEKPQQLSSSWRDLLPI